MEAYESVSNKVKHLDATNIANACSLLDIIYGMDYITRTDLFSYIASPDKYVSCIFDDTGRIIAISLCQVMKSPEESTSILLGNNLQEVREKLAMHTTVGSHKCLVVHPDYVNQGLGKMLMTDSIWWMRAKGTTLFVACVWEREGDQSRVVSRMLARNRFRSFSHTTNFWLKDSKVKGYYCVVCGHPCRCSVTIYVRE